ncbi:MAG: N-6 DNA methylase [Anaerolineaceae bacterium]|nr:N-6 DNA methylase [Anaerolineaceae bacterium]
MKRTINREIPKYYRTLDRLTQQQDVAHEGGLRRAFATLLSSTAKRNNWTLVEEDLYRISSGASIRPDGTLRDQWRLPRGYWEAKDSDDDLDNEIRRKRDRGYPFTNTIFEDTQEAVLYQDESLVRRILVRDKAGLAELLATFYRHRSADFTSFDEAVERFQSEVPNIAKGLKVRIAQAHQANPQFQTTFAEFAALCRKALNPNISPEAIDEMLIQHLMTERLIRKVFDFEDFTRRNVIAREVEKVIDSLTSAHFNRSDFLGSLDRFYTAIERAAERLADFQEKQRFINTIYERFFQGYSVNVADTHGIVYTPQEVVAFMCAAVEQVLQDEFGQQLGDEGVVVIDPCTGTGNYVVHLLRRAHATNPRHFERFYAEQLFANEVMLMPYYIASLNIEHEYRNLTGKYKPFEGLCFVDTLDLGKSKQLRFEFMSRKNTERIERQNKAAINVVIGNPPYNVGQLNENDNNKNRTYELDNDIRNTYSKDSTASLRMQLYDAYVKFFRWATDVLANRDGIVCYISNNSFVDGIAFDGMRKHLMQDFSLIYHLDLAGNIRGGQGQGGNIFDNQSGVGIGITVAVRSEKHQDHQLRYYRVADDMFGVAKRELLESFSEKPSVLNNIYWQEILPDKHHNWIRPDNAQEFEGFLSIGNRAVKATKSMAVGAIFKTYSNGVKTNRDAVAIDFDRSRLTDRIKEFVEEFNAEVDRYKRLGKPEDIDGFVRYEIINWSSTLKSHLGRERYAEFSEESLRLSINRPFTKKILCFDPVLIDRRLVFPRIYPTTVTETENLVLCLSAVGNPKPFHSLIVNVIPDLHLTGDSQCFPLYTYDEDGTNRRENITDWALTQFQTQYEEQDIRKDDIFYYVYGLLHHPDYRERYADNLRRELPRIPFAPDFWTFSDAGRQLAKLHPEYEEAEPYRLHWETSGAIDYRVEKMRPGRKSPSPNGPYRIFDTVKYNDTLTLSGIPVEAFDYRLGTRSALEWVIDQYQVTKERNSDIIRAPNEYSDDPQYIVNLLEKVITVSVETVRIVNELAKLEYR